MSDYANAILAAIETGEKESMDSAFNTAINAKIMDALDAKKIEVAKSIYGGGGSSEEINTSDEEVTTTDTSDEDGTEEV
jgi:hypothetical protein